MRSRRHQNKVTVRTNCHPRSCQARHGTRSYYRERTVTRPHMHVHSHSSASASVSVHARTFAKHVYQKMERNSPKDKWRESGVTAHHPYGAEPRHVKPRLNWMMSLGCYGGVVS